MHEGSRIGRAVVLVVAAVLGGAIALGGAASFGELGHRTTVREIVNAAEPSAPAAFAEDGRMSINDIYRRSAPGVLQVTTTSVATVQPNLFDNPFGLPQQETQRALGSGFVLDKAGHVVTNYHVVQNAKSVEVSFSANDSVRAQIVGVDPSTDLAVLKINAHSRALTPLPLGDSDKTRVGDSVVAIGNPLGLDRTVTAGIVSAVGRPITAPNEFTIDHAIQTDAALNHGNSGGPLINAQGQVIGVNSQIQTGGSSGGNIGIGFAVPINTVRTVAAQLIKHGRVAHAFLGIDVKEIEPSVAALFHLPTRDGLLVAGVCSSSSAARAGLHAGTQNVVVAGESWPLGGDIIVSADGSQTSSAAQLRDAISSKRPGDKLKLTIYRGNKKETLDVKLGRQPTSPCMPPG
jgi:S1-C subfamily serine protease